MTAKKAKVRLVDKAIFRYHFADNPVPASLVDTLVIQIRTWVAMLDFEDPDARADAMQKLREVASAATQEGLAAHSMSLSGKKGGSQPKEKDIQQLGTGKRAAIIAAAESYTGKEAAKVATIQKRTKASPQYIRRILKEIGN